MKGGNDKKRQDKVDGIFWFFILCGALNDLMLGNRIVNAPPVFALWDEGVKLYTRWILLEKTLVAGKGIR